MSFVDRGSESVGEWQRVAELSAQVAAEPNWRRSLADAVMRASGGLFAVVATCPPGRMLDGTAETAPTGYASVVEEIWGKFLPRIEEGADGPADLLRIRTELYAPLEEAHNRELAARLRRDLLEPRGVNGLVNALLVGEGGALVGWIAVGAAVDSATLLVRCQPLREVAQQASRTVVGALKLAAACGMRFPHVDPRIDRLSGRERQLLKLLAQGLSNVNIASQLAISEETVRSHLRTMYAKLEVHSRAEAVGLLTRG